MPADEIDLSAQRALMREVAHAAAQEAVEGILQRLGVDVAEPFEMQEDFAWMRRWRKLSERIGSRILLTVVTLATVGLIGLVGARFLGKS